MTPELVSIFRKLTIFNFDAQYVYQLSQQYHNPDAEYEDDGDKLEKIAQLHLSINAAAEHLQSSLAEVLKDVPNPLAPPIPGNN